MSKLTIGLTGGIASGKTLIATQFEALGVPVLDADEVSRDVVRPSSPALAEIARVFGAGYLNADGTLNRRAMRENVFADAGQRRKLEGILHPLIHARMQQWRDEQTSPYCILSVAILLETRMKDLVDRVLVVDVPVEIQLERLTLRDKISPALAQQMIAAQSTRENRLRQASDIIHNQHSPEASGQQVAQLHQQYLDLAHAAR